MKATDIIYRQVLVNYNKLSIPPFQRSYTWKPKQISGLWKSIIENPPGYFIGSIVCIKTERQGFKLDVVDGQQRLTTLSLVVLAIRDYLIKKGETEKADDFQNFLFFRDNLSSIFDPRINFYKENLNDIYIKLLKKEDLPESLDGNQKKIFNNYKIVYKLVKSYLDLDAGNLIELRNKIENLLFVIILCDSDSDAYKLFEGLNSTGLPLTQVDLVKNGILKNISEKDEKSQKILRESESLWNKMESEFEGYDINLFNTFLRHNWIAENGYISGSNLYDKITEKYLHKSPIKSVFMYVRSLVENASLYIALRQADSALANDNKEIEIIEILKRLNLLGLDQVYEVLLAAHRRYECDPDFSLKQYLVLLRFLWKFSFISKYTTLSPSQYERTYAELANKITSYPGKKLYRDVILKYIKKLQPLILDRAKEFIPTFIEECNYLNSRVLIRLLFQDLFHEADSTINQNNPEAEHILPQEPIEWDLVPEEIEDVVHLIGNLTILSKKENLIADKHPMSVKVKKVFSKSAFKMNRLLKRWEVIFKNDYRTAINKRSLEIAKKLYLLHTQ